MKIHGDAIPRVFLRCRPIPDAEARWLCERSALGVLGVKDAPVGPFVRPRVGCFVIYAVTMEAAWAIVNHEGDLWLYMAPIAKFRPWFATATCNEDREIRAALDALAKGSD